MTVISQSFFRSTKIISSLVNGYYLLVLKSALYFRLSRLFWQYINVTCAAVVKFNLSILVAIAQSGSNQRPNSNYNPETKGGERNRNLQIEWFKKSCCRLNHVIKQAFHVRDLFFQHRQLLKSKNNFGSLLTVTNVKR